MFSFPTVYSLSFEDLDFIVPREFILDLLSFHPFAIVFALIATAILVLVVIVFTTFITIPANVYSVSPDSRTAVSFSIASAY